MVYLVLLIFYDKYYERSLIEIFKLAESITNNYEIIVVDNGSNKNNYENVVFLKGDNSYYEFSGWDVALNYLREKKDVEKANFIFANDTFCFHREWNKKLMHKFSKKFLEFMENNDKGIVGEVNSFYEDYVIDGQVNKEWVSTYMFMLSSEYICDNDFKFNRMPIFWNSNVLSINENEVVFKENFDKKLSKHLNLWLFPVSSKFGWYNAGSSKLTQKQKKLESILNEKELSSFVVKKGGEIFNINAGFFCNLKKIVKKWK